MPNLLRGEAVLFANGIPKVGKVTFTTDLNHVLGFAANRDLGFLAVNSQKLCSGGARLTFNEAYS
jgi:putative protein kinase ArgK-like GTPase of G3E family